MEIALQLFSNDDDDYNDDVYDNNSYDDNICSNYSHYYDNTGNINDIVDKLENDLKLFWDTYLSLSNKHTFVGHQLDQLVSTTTSLQPFTLVGSTPPGGSTLHLWVG